MKHNLYKYGMVFILVIISFFALFRKIQINGIEQSNDYSVDAHSSNVSSQRQMLGSNLENEVVFTPSSEQPFATKKTLTYQELAEKFGIHSEFDTSSPNNTCEILYDKDGHIVRISKNKGLYKSDSKWNSVELSLEKRGFKIMPNGNSPLIDGHFAWKNVLAKTILAHKDSEIQPSSANSEPTFEIEIIPCKLMFTHNEENANWHDIFYDLENDKIYDGVLVVSSTGQRYDQNELPKSGIENLPWERSLAREYTLFCFKEYVPYPGVDRNIPIGQIYAKKLLELTRYELRQDVK